MLSALILVVEDTVETTELKVVGSNLTVLLVQDFAMVDGLKNLLLSTAFFSLGPSGIAGLFLYFMKSGSLSQTKTS